MKYSYGLMAGMLGLISCVAPQRWIDESLPHSMAPETKVASAGLVRTMIGDSVIEAEGKSYHPRYQQMLEHQVTPVQSVLHKTAMSTSSMDRVDPDCFDYEQIIETPNDNRDQRLMPVPGLKESCRQKLWEDSVQYLVAVPNLLSYAKRWGREPIHVVAFQTSMYDVKTGKPVINALNSSYYKINEMVNNDPYFVYHFSKVIPVSNRVNQEQERETMNNMRGIEVLLGLGYYAVGGGGMREFIESNRTMNLIEGQGKLRYMSNSFWGVEYGYAKGKSYLSASKNTYVATSEGLQRLDDQVDIATLSNHSLSVLAYPLYSKNSRLGFGAGINYSEMEIASDITEQLDPDEQLQWEKDSGVGFLLKCQWDVMIGYYRMGMSLGYDFRNAQPMDFDYSMKSFLAEFQLVGFHIPL